MSGMTALWLYWASGINSLTLGSDMMLKGDLKEFFSVNVNGNWRLIFQFEGEDAILVNYLDYH